MEEFKISKLLSRLLINIYAFDTIDEGFASVAEYFPGIEMLLSREDAATCIQAVLEMGSYSVDTENELVRDMFFSTQRYSNAMLEISFNIVAT